jgi:hypothetical protein
LYDNIVIVRVLSTLVTVTKDPIIIPSDILDYTLIDVNTSQLKKNKSSFMGRATDSNVATLKYGSFIVLDQMPIRIRNVQSTVFTSNWFETGTDVLSTSVPIELISQLQIKRRLFTNQHASIRIVIEIRTASPRHFSGVLAMHRLQQEEEEQTLQHWK